MTASTYRLPNIPLTFGHYPNMPSWLADIEEAEVFESRQFTMADAMAASGDCFATLATRLDKLAQGLPTDSSEQIELEHIVQMLFYLQDHWELVTKYKRR